MSLPRSAASEVQEQAGRLAARALADEFVVGAVAVAAAAPGAVDLEHDFPMIVLVRPAVLYRDAELARVLPQDVLLLLRHPAFDDYKVRVRLGMHVSIR